MFKFIIIFLVLLNSAIASPKTEVVKIFDQFVVSSAIASRCEKPNKKTMVKFLTNFTMASIRMRMQLEEKHPTIAKDKIKTAMKIGVKQATSKANKIVDKKGCNDPDIQAIVKRFYMQAK